MASVTCAHHHLDNPYRNTGAPYRSRATKYGRPAVAHHHRTLQLNGSTPSPKPSVAGGGDSDSTSGGWVSKTDRHRQLINANVYDRETRNRTKAIEQTQKAKQLRRRQQEKTQFQEFLQRQVAIAPGTANPNVATGANELTIEGIRFCVVDGGKKLTRINGKDWNRRYCNRFGLLTMADGTNATSATPKTAVVAGVKFYRTKTGNLVVNRVVQDHRYVCMTEAFRSLIKV